MCVCVCVCVFVCVRVRVRVRVCDLCVVCVTSKALILCLGCLDPAPGNGTSSRDGMAIAKFSLV